MLEGGGFSREQAETSVNILVEIMEDKLATKQDIQNVMQYIEKTKSDLTLRMGTMLVASSLTVITVLLKFMK
jgi:hypothetical protein